MSPFCFCQFLERLIFEKMFLLFVENKLIVANQLDFKLGDSCNNQLIAITHKIHHLNDVLGKFKIRHYSGK